MNFVFAIFCVWVIILALFFPDSHELNIKEKWVRNIILLFVVSLTILLSFQMGRINGHHESYMYIYENGDIPPGSPFQVILHDKPDVMPL